jgi:hypothetical protein
MEVAKMGSHKTINKGEGLKDENCERLFPLPSSSINLEPSLARKSHGKQSIKINESNVICLSRDK